MNDSALHTPLVSIIIPNYNYSKFLDERIHSVLNQTFQDFEVIILDDHSTDNSLEVIKKYKNHPKVSAIVVNEENSGSPFKQWYKGIQLAKGNLIWIAESDDSCDIQLLERNVKSFQNDEKCVLSFACSVKMDDNGDLHEVMQDLPNDITLEGKKFNQRYMYCGCFLVNASSALFKKVAAMSVDSVFTQYKGGGDRVFWMEIAKCGNVNIINEPLNYFRKHSSNLTSKLYNDGIDFYEAKRTYDFIKTKYGISWLESLRICKYYVYRIKYVEFFSSEQVSKDLIDYWAPGFVVIASACLQRFIERVKNYIIRFLR